MASKFSNDSKYKFRLSEMPSESQVVLPSIQGFEREPLIPIVPQVNHMVWTTLLKVLGLKSTGIIDESAEYLAEKLKTNKTLISLGLDENDIGNRGLQLLANALNQYLVKNKMASYLNVDSLVQMNRLWIDDCNLSLKEKEKFRQSIHSRNRFSLSA